MIVRKYLAEIVSIKTPTQGVYTIEFKSSKKFKYNVGEFLHLSLDEYDPSGAWPESRCFSIQTSPKEETLKITYSVKGQFTSRMEKELKEGSSIWLKLPYGDLFTQEHEKTNTVFISGGTGITPFLSLFTDKCFSEYEHPKLYLGFRDQTQHFYQRELELAKNINPDLQIRVFYQDKEGIIDIEEIYNQNPDAGALFISGPPVMIRSFREYLLSKGVEESRIKTDDWE